MFHSNRRFFEESKEFMETMPGLLEFCTDKADLDGLSYLVNMYPRKLSIDDVICNIGQWNFDSLARSSMKVNIPDLSQSRPF